MTHACGHIATGRGQCDGAEADCGCVDPCHGPFESKLVQTERTPLDNTESEWCESRCQCCGDRFIPERSWERFCHNDNCRA